MADAAAVDQAALEGRAGRAAERQRARADAGRGERARHLAHVQQDRQAADPDRQAPDQRGEHDQRPRRASAGCARRRSPHLSYAAVEPDAVEIRVVACLVEKQRTTPDQYPLTLNSLRLACNQSTNRDPVVDYDEATIRSALDRLGRRKWTTLASWSTARSVKYKHVLDQALGLERPAAGADHGADAARPADPRRAAPANERIHRFESGEELDRALEELVERELAVALPRRPGERGQRYAHRLGRGRARGSRRVPEPHRAARRRIRPSSTPGVRAPRGRGGGAARAAARPARRAGRLDPPLIGDLATAPECCS